MLSIFDEWFLCAGMSISGWVLSTYLYRQACLRLNSLFRCIAFNEPLWSSLFHSNFSRNFSFRCGNRKWRERFTNSFSIKAHTHTHTSTHGLTHRLWKRRDTRTHCCRITFACVFDLRHARAQNRTRFWWMRFVSCFQCAPMWSSVLRWTFLHETKKQKFAFTFHSKFGIDVTINL